MACEPFRELISARLDGEADPVEAATVDEHLRGCVDCQAHAFRIGELQRPLRMQAMQEVPDLAAHLVATLPPVRRPLRDDLARVALTAIAITQLVFSIPQLFAVASSEPIHTARHLGSWDLAFAVGLLVVAWSPRRARGLLPMATALAGAMIVTAVVDLRAGHTAGLAEASHLLEIAGVLLVWALARTTPPGLGPGRASWRTAFSRLRRSPARAGGLIARAGVPVPAGARAHAAARLVDRAA